MLISVKNVRHIARRVTAAERYSIKNTSKNKDMKLCQ